MSSWTADLLQKRARSKVLFNKHLFEIFNSSHFQQTWNDTICGQNGFKVDQIDAKYKQQIVNILSYCFSFTSTTLIDPLLSTNVAQNYVKYSCIINHIIKTGLGMVITDKNDNVIMISYAYDYTDMPQIPSNIISNNLKKRAEFFQHITRATPIHSQNIKAISYGDFLFAATTAVRPDYWGKIKALKMGLCAPTFISMGYKYYATIAQNIKYVHWVNQMHKTFNWWSIVNHNIYDLNIKFKDGTMLNDYIHKKPQYHDKRKKLVVTYHIQDWIQFKQQLNGESCSGSKLGVALYLAHTKRKLISNL
eukprot:547774_1